MLGRGREGGRDGKGEGDGGGVREAGVDLVTAVVPACALCCWFDIMSCQTAAYEFCLNLQVSQVVVSEKAMASHSSTHAWKIL